MVRSLVILGLSLIASGAYAQSFEVSNSSSYSYAQTMQQTGVFQHDPSYRGAEVIFYSSGNATPAQARRAWLRSPAHRRLLLTGKIRNVSCYGNYCVGR